MARIFGPIFLRDRAAIGRLLLERHIPSIGAFRKIVEPGVAMNYGIDLAVFFAMSRTLSAKLPKVPSLPSCPSYSRRAFIWQSI